MEIGRNTGECAQFVTLGIQQEKIQKVEHWNSMHVTFNLPNNQQLRDLGILSTQIEGEGVINLAFAQN